MKNPNKSAAEILRQKVEELLKKKLSKKSSQLSESETLKLIHELEVHQVELGMQNDELMLANKRAESIAYKYVELYDFAPSGYFTLSKLGAINELNLTATKMLGKDRQSLLNNRFVLYVSEDTRPNFYLFFDKIFLNKTNETCEVELLIEGNIPMHVLLSGRLLEDEDQCFMSMVDITDRVLAEKNLIASEERFKQAFYTNPDSININRLVDGMYVSVNKGFTKMSGYSQEDVEGKTSLEIDIWVDVEDRKKLVAALKKNGKVLNFPARFRKKNGSIIDGLMSASIIELMGVAHILNITRDITEFKQAQDALNESERRYRLLVESVNEGILVAQDSRLKFVNKGIIEVSGYTEQELLNTPYIEFIHPDDRKLVMEISEKNSIDYLTKRKYEVRIITKDKSTKWIEFSRVRIEWEGKPAVMNFGIDITERKKAEKALLESEMMYRTLFENTGTAVMVVEDDATVSLSNKRFEKYTGYTKSEIEGGKKWMEIVGKEDVERMLARHKQRREFPKQGKANYEFSYHNKKGEKRYALINAELVPGTMKTIISLVDITERQDAENENKKLFDKLEATLNAIPDLLFEVGLDGLIYNYHTRSSDLLAAPPEVFLGKHFWEVLPADASQVCDSAIQEASEKGLSIGKQYSLLLPQGKTWFEVSVAPFSETINQEKRFIFLARDITERRKAEFLIKESEEKYRFLTENIADVIWTYNLSLDKFTYVSPSIFQLRGYTVTEAMEHKLLDALTPESAQIASKEIDSHIKDLENSVKKTLIYQFQQPTKEGVVKWTEAVIKCRYTIEGDIELHGVTRDITERKKAENELLKLSRILAFNSQVNDLILHTKNREQLFKEICHIISVALL